MKKASPDSDSQIDRIRSWARSKTHGTPPRADSSNTASTLPVSNSPAPSTTVPLQSIAAGTATGTATHTVPHNDTTNIPPFPSTDVNGLARQSSKPTSHSAAAGKQTSAVAQPSASSPQAAPEGPVVGATPGDGDANDNDNEAVKLNVFKRFWITSKSIILSSYVNWLLVFVPIGIASKAANLDPGIIFGMNAIAIVPLAGLLSHATESVAKRMGDTIGALMNVTFGNAVELIIFIIALTKNEIRIVQASLLGSILANLLLILGMCFLVGGLRYREQIYNSTVTQMSACLLSLSVMSLLLPTAFHASFNTENKDNAEKNVLKVSRGTSVILLIVYGMYLLFQLKSHAYMYESTPQHIIDEEMAPGPVAAWMDTDSDTSSSSSSSSSDSDHSNTTAKRIKRVMRAGRRHRKSSAGSKDTATLEGFNKPTSASNSISPVATEYFTEEPRQMQNGRLAPIDPAEDGDDEKKFSRRSSVAGHSGSKKERKKDRKRREKREKRERKARRNGDDTLIEGVGADGEKAGTSTSPDGPRRVDFAPAQVEETPTESGTASATKRPFNLRAITNIRPQLPSAFSQNVFTHPTPASPITHTGSIPRVRYGIRRTNSLPDRLNETAAAASRVQTQSIHQPARVNSTAVAANVAAAEKDDEENISRTTAVLLLLISTGLVAVCAEFLVDSISAVVESNVGISEAFIGLIILPIVGNAAEHVTAVTVAAKNKVDLAIGVAVGSSIQIALFVTPFVVLLGWAMGKDMSLYFTLFETVSLFVSAFIVNFLVLDGRSNYLEGALLCASYVIIAISAFFYPNVENQSNLGGNAEANNKMIRSLMGF